MLHLKNITKDYVAGDTTVRALTEVNLTFRKSEFVSILGPSGCGKTTMLNIIGGLDRYTTGDLIIDGKSTKDFKPYDWDAYRNASVGFVFQSYNLISHQSILGNVEMALTLSGVNAAERKRKATEALQKVGLGDITYKKPNQLSGGQMQRVAIARAIVNDPEIILADEPTGALDSKTSVQILDLLKEIALDRLIIMVTHNNELAEKYSTRIINLLDGNVVSDTNPYSVEQERIDEKRDEKEESIKIDPTGLTQKQIDKLIKKQNKEIERKKRKELKKTSMSFVTATKLSGKNLLTKKGRTFMTAFAGSIGIIGIALVLSISNGFQGYINKTQAEMLSGYPVTIAKQTTDTNNLMDAAMSGGNNSEDREEYPDGDKLDIYKPQMNMGLSLHINKINKDYLDYIEGKGKYEGQGIDKTKVNDIKYSYGTSMNVLSKSKVKVNDIETDLYTPIATAKSDALATSLGFARDSWQELLTNDKFVNSQYDVLEGKYPTQKEEVALVVDKYNRISESVFRSIGLNVDDPENAVLSDVIDKELSFVLNDNWYGTEPIVSVSGTSGRFEGCYKYIREAKANNNPNDNPLIRAEAQTAFADAYEKGLKLKVVGVMRVKEGTPLSMYNTGLVYTPKLSEYLREDSKNSEIVKTQLINNEWNYIDGKIFKPEQQSIDMGMGSVGLAGILSKEQVRENALQSIGGSDIPSVIYLYPTAFETKGYVTSFLNNYNTINNLTKEEDKIIYTDAAEMISETMGEMINIISIALVGFAAVSLVVSSIMIGIITYVSVIERTKEIGILRSIGARKKDISRVFNAETLLIGFCAGFIGVAIAFILTFPISMLIKSLADGMVTTSLAVLNPLHALLLVVLSMGLTMIAGLIPSRVAAKKDPVVALRSE